MRRYNVVSRIILILTVITFALAAPVLVQEKCQACVDVVHVPEDVITMLGKRTLEEDLNVLWDRWWHYENVLREPAPPPNVPPQSPADSILDDSPPESPESGHSHLTWTSLLDSDRESMELGDNTPPESPESEHSHSPPTGPEWSTDSEDWYTAPSSLGSSDSDSARWSTISNAPSVESQSENLNAADYELKGKAKVSRRISGTASGVHTVG